MELLHVIIISIHLTVISTKKKYKDSSSESIENILYYKDCKHNKKPPEVQLLQRAEPPPPPPPQECKMCCTMCCGDQCVDTHQLSLGRQQPGAQPKVQPITPRERRKKPQPPQRFQPPASGRRGLGFTRENIKSLISQDEDIRKILKDLVRVTMQKVDLVQMINSKQSVPKPEPGGDASGSANDL